MFTLKHNRYPELSTFDKSGAVVRFREGLLETDDEDLVRSLDQDPDVEIVSQPEAPEEQEPRPAKKSRARKSA